MQWAANTVRFGGQCATMPGEWEGTLLEALHYGFIRHALAAGVLASVACGIVGTYVVVKRIAFISGGISHASFGGIGIALYLGVAPALGATLFGLLSAVVIGLVSARGHENEDTLIGALWASGMAVGVIFIQLTPGATGSLENFLFGNILLVSGTDLAVTAVLDGVILLTVGVLYKEFLALSLDEEFAHLRGVPVTGLYILLLCLVALTVVVLIQVVGIILVIALLTLPPAISRWFTRQLNTMMLLSCVLGAFFTFAGVFVSYYTDYPAGASIVLLAAAAYLVGIASRRVFGRRLAAAVAGIR